MGTDAQRVSRETEPADGASAGATPAAAASAASVAPAAPAVPRKPWHAFATPLIGKGVRRASRLLHHGGSAFPGKIAETIDPGFLARTLAQLPLGVVLVSGTNGKTTTTRMVATMLADLGLRVFTNPTGSNFTRGVASALLEQVSLGGRLDADIAVLELDEAYAVHFVRQCRPRYALLLNVMRDQLDRFGEIDNTARLLGHVAEATTGTVVLNREDPRIARLADLVRTPGADVRWFGLSDDLRRFFPSDDDMTVTIDLGDAAATTDAAGAASAGAADGDAGAPTVAGATAPAAGRPDADVILTRVGDHRADLTIDGVTHTTDVRLEGVYNLYNAAAALAVVRAVQADPRTGRIIDHASGRGRAALAARIRDFRDAGTDALVAALAGVTPAFGRGEIIDVNGHPTELLLVKNPMGFRLALASFPPDGADTMICINDEYADGRDMSWLWDVDFSSLRDGGVKQVSGVRAWDMALRLEYDRVPVGATDTDLDAALAAFVAADPAHPGRRRHIYCTYTAMLHVRAALARIADVADAGVGR
ncbi:Mur ligase family protein [Bifidobacterium samirii]|uniref:Lipid II isoglutaminyl synthase (glutamine-hydrolyzing) subunit MurT n=1 Tax=Bifidobacterium samirii TaxID=2306974 RepID=A0A430FNK8_9BIFI|nr:Mur ligase family protein [Bifidobacterium samirii]RSX54423.1 glutamate ligase [Bifidobacterium samirii]